MAERDLLFTWDLQLFNENLNQSNDLLPLRNEFAMRGFSLSQSLLIWQKDGNWSLVDFENEKAYYIEINNDEVEVSEETGEAWRLTRNDLVNLFSDYVVYGTHEGFVDWVLKAVTFDRFDLDDLKRTDLSSRRLSFEIVHPNLLAVHKIVQEILASSRESLIDLSGNDLQQVRNCLQQLWDIFDQIHRFDSQNSREEHRGVLQEIVSFCNNVRQQLGPTVAYLRSKRVEQLETQVNATVANTVTDAVKKLNTEADRLQKHSDQAEENEVKRQEDFNQLKSQVQDLLAEESVSKYEKVFAEQANKHQEGAFWWLISTVGLIVVFGFVFYWLFDSLKLGGGVLQNLLTKGFLLSLIYLVLNRSLKNYTAEKHLEVVNRHRQNALRTFNAFHSAAGENQETQDAVLLAATNAIFDANQSGYLSTKTRGSESTNPIPQVIKAVVPSSSTRSD